jgi:hypothetical protein
MRSYLGGISSRGGISSARDRMDGSTVTLTAGFAAIEGDALAVEDEEVQEVRAMTDLITELLVALADEISSFSEVDIVGALEATAASSRISSETNTLSPSTLSDSGAPLSENRK